MGIWNSICGFFGIGIEGSPNHVSCDINPATGLPMIDGCGGVDVGGNPFGTNMHDSSSIGSGISDTFSSGVDTFGSLDFGSFNDSWNSWSD